ncbi:uncharacterized protein [Diadema setosum]|uniref:uncharacterized protein n=1 Tax=Diadema setosum TaxID=31175 RepID=UPI003B3AC590
MYDVDCSDCTDQGFFDMNPSLCRNFCMNNLVNKRSSCDQCSSVRCTLLCSRKRSYDPNQENHREVQKRTQVSQMCILDDLYQDLPEEGKTEVINTFARWIHFD